MVNYYGTNRFFRIVMRLSVALNHYRSRPGVVAYRFKKRFTMRMMNNEMASPITTISVGSIITNIGVFSGAIIVITKV